MVHTFEHAQESAVCDKRTQFTMTFMGATKMKSDEKLSRRRRFIVVKVINFT